MKCDDERIMRKELREENNSSQINREDPAHVHSYLSTRYAT